MSSTYPQTHYFNEQSYPPVLYLCFPLLAWQDTVFSDFMSLIINFIWDCFGPKCSSAKRLTNCFQSSVLCITTCNLLSSLCCLFSYVAFLVPKIFWRKHIYYFFCFVIMYFLLLWLLFLPSSFFFFSCLWVKPHGKCHWSSVYTYKKKLNKSKVAAIYQFWVVSVQKQTLGSHFNHQPFSVWTHCGCRVGFFGCFFVFVFFNLCRERENPSHEG